jgi:hypothetical protein
MARWGPEHRDRRFAEKRDLLPQRGHPGGIQREDRPPSTADAEDEPGPAKDLDVVGHQRVAATHPLAEIGGTHPGFALGEGARAQTGRLAEEHDDAEPQGISERAEAANQVLSRQREHEPPLHVAMGPGPHRVRSHQSRWGTCLEEDDGSLERSF